jgi:hypothetical protein
VNAKLKHYRLNKRSVLCRLAFGGDLTPGHTRRVTRRKERIFRENGCRSRRSIGLSVHHKNIPKHMKRTPWQWPLSFRRKHLQPHRQNAMLAELPDDTLSPRKYQLTPCLHLLAILCIYCECCYEYWINDKMWEICILQRVHGR